MEDFQDLLLYFGKFHPLLVHLPIGALFVVPLLDWVLRENVLLSSLSRKFLVGFLFLSSSASCAVGYLLSLSGEYEGDILNYHFYLGIALSIVFLGWLLLHFLTIRTSIYHKIHYSFYFASLVLVSAVGHLGGSLTHG